MDINYQEEDKSISPPWKFLETPFLQKVCDLANPANAYIALNVIYYNEEAKKRVCENITNLQDVDHKLYAQVEESSNKLCLLSRS